VNKLFKVIQLQSVENVASFHFRFFKTHTWDKLCKVCFWFVLLQWFTTLCFNTIHISRHKSL